MSDTPLSEVFSTEADQKIVEPVEEEAIETEEVTDEVTAESTEEADQEAAPSAEDKPDDVKTQLEQIQAELNAFKTKALDERTKRQALEQQLQQKQEAPDAYVEPDKAIEYGINKAVSQADQRFLNYAFENAKDKWGDFLEMQDVFFDELAAENPQLTQQAMQQADPYKFIYQQAKQHAEFKEIGDISSYKQRLRDELKAELQAEMQSQIKQQAEEAITRSIPNTLSTATAAAGTGSKGFSGPTPLDKVFSNQ